MSELETQPAADSENTTAPISQPAPKRRRLWVRLLMWTAIFFSGMVVGGVAHAVVTKRTLDLVLKHPEQIPDRLMPMLRSRLSLSPEQAEKVERIVRARHREIEAIRADSHPRMTAEFESLRSEVSTELNEKQRERWHAWCDFVEARFLPAPPKKNESNERR